MAEKKRQLTELQKKFLDVLVDEAKGDYKLALKLAGYSEHTKVSEVVDSLREEIIKTTMDSIVLDGPRAAARLRETLENPNMSGAINVIKVASGMLDRIGILNQTQGLNVKVPKGGLMILPAKGGRAPEPSEDDEEE